MAQMQSKTCRSRTRSAASLQPHSQRVTPQDDEIIPQFGLNFDLGRLKSASNESYLLPANVDEEEPGQRAREGRIFAKVPTPFDELIYKHFAQWE